jgi:hypothetical protein
VLFDPHPPTKKIGEIFAYAALLVHRCNGATAGLGHWEVGLGCSFKCHSSDNEPVTALSCSGIWTLDSLNDKSDKLSPASIQAVRATDVSGIGSSPAWGKLGNSSTDCAFY